MADRKTTLEGRLTVLDRREDLILGPAEREGRALTDGDRTELQAIKTEREQVEAQLVRLDGDAQLMAQVNAFAGGKTITAKTATGAGPTPRTAGEFFAMNEDVAQFFKAGLHRSAGGWRSPTVEIPYAALFATTLSEGAGSGGALVVPDYQVGIVPSVTRPVVVADLLSSGTTDSNAVIYMLETAFTNSAAPTAEGSAKPESALVFTQVSEPTSKLAHWLPVTEELLEDGGAIRSYLDARLRLGVQLAEDDQLLSGNGTPPNLRGLLNRTGLATTVVRTDPETNADAIARQIAAIATTSNVQPDGVIMHPSNFLTIQLLKDTSNAYIAEGPLAPLAPPMLWGLRVALTTGIAVGTALVGAFKIAAQVFRKGGIRVEASNSHQDFFIKNLVAIRAEERLALAVYRPGSVGKVTGLT